MQFIDIVPFQEGNYRLIKRGNPIGFENKPSIFLYKKNTFNCIPNN